MNDPEDLRFPVGPFRPNPHITAEERLDLIHDLARFPSQLRAAVAELSESQLDTPYREGGWTVRQVVHHLPDSHMQSYVRFKLAMTEDLPTIRTYDQAAWGEAADARTGPVEVSLDLLEALHRRWVLFLRSLSDEDFSRCFRHPEMGEISLSTTVQLYAWHGKHHLGHVRLVADRE